MSEKPIYHTPHIVAEPGDFADTVLMPGDPLRAKFIAEEFFDGAKLVNNIRGVQGYTGFYRGVRVSVMASGMGIPSIGIYSNELFRLYGVKNIIRVGTAGAIREDVRLGDIVLGMGACTNSDFARHLGLPGTFAPIADFSLLSFAVSAAEARGLSVKVGNLFSTDNFYTEVPGGDLVFGEKMGVLAVEMEAAGLYVNAARLGARALAVCSVADQLVTHETVSAENRRTQFSDMILLALDTAVAAEKLS